MSSLFPLHGLCCDCCDVQFFQTVKVVNASQDVLVDLFERIENFFVRLGTYIEVPPTPGMMDMLMKIMAEVLSILGIATREIKQSTLSELIHYDRPCICANNYLELFVKKLVGRSDMEDALRILDKLTQEEARMAAAQVLKATHDVDGRVREVGHTVLDGA